jgi:hypothetical protein
MSQKSYLPPASTTTSSRPHLRKSSDDSITAAGKPWEILAEEKIA